MSGIEIVRGPGAWAVKPSACETCSARKLVTWSCDSEVGVWSLTCAQCLMLGPRLVQPRGGHVVLAVRELPAMLTIDGPEVELWSLPDRPIRSSIVAAVLAEFARLGRRRVVAVRQSKVPPWALYRDDSGAAWAPGDPLKWAFAFELQPAELVRTTIGRRRRKATCRSCKAEISEGVTAWRPDNRAWTSKGQALRWCDACVHAVTAQTDDSPEPVEHVRHLRVFAGGSDGEP